METGHSVQYDKATRLASSQSYFARKHREALEILKHPDNFNRDKDEKPPIIYMRTITQESSISELSALKMQTATFAKWHYAVKPRGIHPETFCIDDSNGRESLKTRIESY
ncbi:uncharacterized protein LOC114928557 [Nylanderia fulva]|uniref:uncharacterized protein LOC114928557 n=1 Tax=Nylanderia fulva TaxID=613905 RepID=UPI0010FB131F|nr:uncharacterized protein LOC114928557 [Nylanderia fulva]